MALTLQQQVSRESSSENKPPLSNHTNKDPSKQAKHQNRVPTSLKQQNRHSSTSSPQSDSLISPALQAHNRYQASKVFISKCRDELEALLEDIKDSYHNDIKSLYSNELYADFFFQVGEEFKKPLHKCIFASRAFKLYNSLKAFRLVAIPVEEDIIISEFQGRVVEEKEESEDKNAPETLDSTSVDSSKSIIERESLESAILECHLSSDIISFELFLNFARRIYLDQDLLEEEVELNKRLINWLKLNRPDLIKAPVNYPINHRESFRTIQPDFEDTSQLRSPIMSPDNNTNVADDSENNADDLDETSQAHSMRDVSLTSSLLTRTETFELISKSNVDSPSIGTPSKKVLTDDEGEVYSDKSNLDDTNTPTPYAPTTRTGLKPKTFTTPTGLRNNTTRVETKKSAPKSITQNEITSKTKASPRVSLSKQGSKGSTPSTAPRRSNQPDEATLDAQINVLATTSKSQKSPAINTAIVKAKPTVITRAHPISMERSQSPSTTTLKGTTRNFIVANKRLISQIEKKQPVVVDQCNDESDNEASDTSTFVLEPLNSDNLIAQIDKITLVSYSKLAHAMSMMFIDEILPDTIIQVKEGKQIKAHKCILASRSAYMNEYISKHNLPQAKPELAELASKDTGQRLTIDLTEYSHPAVYFCVLHMYAGVVKVPDDLDLDELTKLSHLLHITTLTQVCIHNLRVNYCHFFHKPCSICSVGVLKTLPLAWRYDYMDLYSKCLQWIGSHFANIFCLKEFAELKPHDLLEECYSATLNQLTPDNIIPKTIECQKLLKNLPRVKWTESIICLVGRLLEDFCHYVADNYEKILESDSFLNLGKNSWECEILEENLLAAMNHLKPDSGCKTLIQLHKIECSNEFYCEDPAPSVSDSFSNLILKMRKYCERYLLKEATAVVHCSSWRHMNPSLQKRIRDQAIISTDFDEPTKQLTSKPKLPSMSRLANQQQSSQSNSSSCDGAKSPNSRSTPESRLKSPSTTYLPPPKNKTAAARHVKVLK